MLKLLLVVFAIPCHCVLNSVTAGQGVRALRSQDVVLALVFIRFDNTVLRMVKEDCIVFHHLGGLLPHHLLLVEKLVQMGYLYLVICNFIQCVLLFRFSFLLLLL